MADQPTTIYFPQDLYLWLVQQRALMHTPLTQLVVRYCQEARTRLELEAGGGDD